MTSREVEERKGRIGRRRREEEEEEGGGGGILERSCLALYNLLAATPKA